MAYRLTPNASAAAIASPIAAVGWAAASTVRVRSGPEATQMPVTIAASVTATRGASGSPAISAITAATAPSVETSGATNEICPIRRAR